MPAIIVMIIFGSLTTLALGIRYMRHRERLAELYVRRVEALAAAHKDALPEQKDKLARELLEAYDDVDRDLRD